MEIYEIIGKILGAVAVALLAWLSRKVYKWLEVNTTSSEEAAIRSLVRSFCRAAEHLLKEDDPSGQKRHAYVVAQLEALGIEITEMVLGILEGEVYAINRGDGHD